MKNIMSIIVCAVLIVGITSCENNMFDEENISNQENNINNNSGIAGGFFSDSGCDLYINGSFENGAGGIAAFSKNHIDRWGAAFGTGDSFEEYEGSFPFSGNKLAHMQRYKGNPDHYESIFLKMPLKSKNKYDVDYRMISGDLRMEVFVFDEVEDVDINSIIPNYINSLNGPGYSQVGLGFSTGNTWGLRTLSFTSRSGKLVFIPQSLTTNNPYRMLLDYVQINCEYGYLDEIYADIIQTTEYGYDYQFNAEISENNPNLSYLWTFSYLNGSFSTNSESPVINFPFSINKPYKVETCLDIVDVDGCCVQECIEFEVGSEIIPPPPIDSICNYSVCLDNWLTSCDDGFVYVNGTRVSFLDDYEKILDELINNWVTELGYDPVNTSITYNDDCKNIFVVECSPIPISIGYSCGNGLLSPESSSKKQLKLKIFESDCTVDCAEGPK